MGVCAQTISYEAMTFSINDNKSAEAMLVQTHNFKCKRILSFGVKRMSIDDYGLITVS
ncbi:unnamed protein product [marine sediment metagenome]|uniref:Uncharacterized protein n=1 Tax=marine sediment metagenome TaxID=412755 RepID=X1HAH8_9ZZZZ